MTDEQKVIEYCRVQAKRFFPHLGEAHGVALVYDWLKMKGKIV